MHDMESAPIALRILTALPLGRGLAAIGRVEAEQVDCVARPQPHGGVRLRREFAVEVDIRSAGPIEELEISQQGSSRPDILDVKDFAPSIVTNHDVGNEPVTVEPLAQPRHREPVGHAIVQLAHIGVRV
jgi:hypothetical protein